MTENKTAGRLSTVRLRSQATYDLIGIELPDSSIEHIDENELRPTGGQIRLPTT
jgi:hypothetical protein